MFKEIEAAMQVSMRNALGMMTNKPIDGLMDDLIIMKVQEQFFLSMLIEMILIKFQMLSF